MLLSLLLYLLVPWLAVVLGASEKMAPLCVEYARILAICMPFQILNGAFHPLLITADRPGLGLLVSVVNACMNILLDWIVVAKLGWGMKGAAIATVIGQFISALIVVIYCINFNDIYFFCCTINVSVFLYLKNESCYLPFFRYSCNVY